MKRLILLFGLVGVLQGYAQTGHKVQIYAEHEPTTAMSATVYFNGLKEYASPSFFTEEITNDCSMLFRYKGYRSSFVHLKLDEINAGKSEVFNINPQKTVMRVQVFMKPLVLIDKPDYSNALIPKFLRLELDPALAHTFQYSMRLVVMKEEGQLDKIDFDESIVEETIYKAFKDKMRLVDPEKSMFHTGNEQTHISDDLLLGGVVKLLTYNFKGLKRQLNLAVEWSVYSKSRDSVIFKNIVDIEFTMDKNYRAIPFYDGVSMSIDKLLSYYPEFIEALKTNAITGPIKVDDPIHIKLLRAHSTQQPRLADVARQSVVTVLRPDGGHGSGFLISSDGYLLTNAHVVDTYTELSILLESGLRVPAKVIRTNTSRDVALLKMDISGFSPAVIVKEESDLGSDVFVVGTPAAITLGQSVSKGVLSGYRTEDEQRYIQTDASINPGNSGGPLFNESLEVIGIVVSKIAHEQIEGISFVIPIQDALSALNIRKIE